MMRKAGNRVLRTQYRVLRTLYLSTQLLPALHKINSAAIAEVHGHINETDGKNTTPAQKRTRIQQTLAGWQDSISALSPPADDTETKESTDMDWKDIDLDGLKQNRPELLTALQESFEKGDELKAIQEELKTLKAEKADRELQEAIAGELTAAGLDPANKTHCSEVFLEDLRTTADAARRKAKIDDRKALVGRRSRPRRRRRARVRPCRNRTTRRPSRRPRHH